MNRTMIRAMIRVTMLTVLGLALWGLSPAELGLAPVAAQAPDELAAPAAWAATDDVALRAETLAWLEQQELDDSVRGQASALWPESADGVLETAPPTATETDLLDRLVETFAVADPRARQLVDTCREPFSTGAAAAEDWLYAEDTSPFVSANLRVYRGRWLTHRLLFDEARAELEGLTPDDVAAPATLLFYQAVAYHRLLDREAGLKVIKQLLDGEDQSPRRYTALARLMQQDLRGLKDDSLDHIARRMDDIERRLALGRAGAKVRGIEDGVIESLDKLIEELEQQQQQQSSRPGASNQSSSPLQDSRLMGGGGPGRVDKKDIGSKSGWGDLPQKEREQAMQQIGREFPAHYRDIIEQYFRNRAGSQ